MPKRVELISELVPHAGVIALLVNPQNPQTEPSIQGVQEATGTKGLRCCSTSWNGRFGA